VCACVCVCVCACVRVYVRVSKKQKEREKTGLLRKWAKVENTVSAHFQALPSGTATQPRELPDSDKFYNFWAKNISSNINHCWIGLQKITCSQLFFQ